MQGTVTFMRLRRLPAPRVTQFNQRSNASFRAGTGVLLRCYVPYLWGFLTPPVAGADFRAALVANCFLGAFPPVDLRAVCLVRAMLTLVKVFQVSGNVVSY